MEKAVFKNQIVQIEITGYNSDGAGVGRVKGFCVFVPGTIEGETVTVQILKVSKNYAVGKLTAIEKASPHRVEQPCPVFSKCGGCSLLHMDPAAQRNCKIARVTDCYMRLAHIDPPGPVVLHSMNNALRYRNKCSFPVQEINGSAQAGLFSYHSHRLIPVHDCLLQKADNARIVEAVLAWMHQYHIKAYDEKTHKGCVRHIVTRWVTSGEWIVCLVVADQPTHTGELLDMLRHALPQISSVVLNHNNRTDNVIMGASETVLFGPGVVRETLAGSVFSVSSRSFLQVNPVQTEILYGLALSFADLSGNETVVDAHCGAGTMSLLFSHSAKKVIGIDCVAPAIENARENAVRNNVNNVSFYCDLAEKAVPRLINDGVCFDLALLDPPRKGCDPALLESLWTSKIPRIVYVSCDPATQARDVSLLCAHGYCLEKLEAVDMFPQTAHVETVVLLSRETNPLTVEVRMEVETGEVKEHPTYKRIQEYVQEKYGFKVHTAYIAEVKRMVGLDMHKAPNAVEQRKHEYHPCPPEKVEAIKDALRHFGLIAE